MINNFPPKIVSKYIFKIALTAQISLERGINASIDDLSASENKSRAPLLSKSKYKWLLPRISYLISTLREA